MLTQDLSAPPRQAAFAAACSSKVMVRDGNLYVPIMVEDHKELKGGGKEGWVGKESGRKKKLKM